MKAFMDRDFLLVNETAKHLFHRYAKTLPLVDYHCHIPPKEIYEDRRFDNISQIWLGGRNPDGTYFGDHYKWRLMRSNGIPENLVTGDADPFDKFCAFAKTLEMAMERIRLISRRQHKELYIQTFGRFLVMRDGVPLPLTGKAKEILALVVTRRGKEISNEEIYSTLWEGREYSNANMSVLYNALHRLKKALKEANCENLLISTTRGQMINTTVFDCDYYAWQDKNMGARDKFEGEFLSEYSWGEYILANILNEEGW